MTENTRKAHVLQADESFKIMETIDLKEGMVFKLFEDDATPVIGLYSDLFLALNDAHYDEEGNIIISVKMLGEPEEVLQDEALNS